MAGRSKNIGQPVPLGHVVREMTIGNTRIKICDDCCRDKTPEDVEKILRRVAQLALPALQAAYLAREKAGEHPEKK